MSDPITTGPRHRSATTVLSPVVPKAFYEFKRKSRCIGGYKCIVADPPWDFNGAASTARRSVHRHFPVMPLAAIKALPVRELAARDCALFLWMIDTHEAEARGS